MNHWPQPSSRARRHDTAEILFVVFITALALLATGCGHGGIFGSGYGPGTPEPKPHYAPTAGAASSFAVMKIMALGLFFPAVALFVAGFALSMPPLIRPAIAAIFASVVIGAVPWVLDWIHAVATLPLQIAFYAVLAMVLLFIGRKLFLAKKAKALSAKAQHHRAMGQEGLANETQAKANEAINAVEKIIPLPFSKKPKAGAAP